MTPAAGTGLSIGVATGIYGISFGALGVAAGLSVWQTCALSLLMFTGGSQFAFIGVIAQGGTGPSALGAASLLGVRNAVYGMQLNALMSPRGWRRLLAAHVTIDESTANALSQPDPAEQRTGFWWAGLAVFALWNGFTLLGAVAGNSMGDPAVWGLDGAAVAAFMGLLWPRLKDRPSVAVAVLAALVSAISLPAMPSGIPILLAALIAGAVGYLSRPGRPKVGP